MDFNLNEEQQILRDSACKFLNENYSFQVRYKRQLNQKLNSRDIWSIYAEMGWLALEYPEDVGGSACSFVETIILVEEFGRFLSLEPYLSTVVLCGTLVGAIKSKEKQKYLLTSIGDGTNQVTLAHLEKNSRCEYDFGISAIAKRIDDGYLITGKKCLVPNAKAADWWLITARLDGASSLSVFAVRSTNTKIQMNTYQTIDGSSASDIEFDGLVVPFESLIIDEYDSNKVLLNALDRATVAQMAESVGAMEMVANLCSEYLKTRVQFGHPIGNFQALQHYMADIFVEIQESRSAMYRALAHLSSEAENERTAAISLSKAMVGKAGKLVAALGIQLHGGIGMTDEYPISHYFKKLVSNEKLLGDTDFHLERYCKLIK